jgi:GNAT superfamily N-acetyltransferase
VPDAYHVRRAASDDAEAFTEQRIAAFREIYALAPGLAADEIAAATRVSFRASIERGTCVAWLAVGGGEAIGSTALFLVERLPSPPNPRSVEGYLAHLYVAPAWRRAGVGSALVRAALDEARARSLGRVRLHATEPGRPLYERAGFRMRTNDMERFV